MEEKQNDSFTQVEFDIPKKENASFTEEVKEEQPKQNLKYEQLTINHPIFQEKEKKKKSKSKIFFSVLLVLVNVGVILYAAINDFSGNKNPASFMDIVSVIGQNWYYLVFALISFAFMFIFDGLKMSLMLFSLTKKMRFSLCLETAIYNKYYDNVTPFAVGGQPFAIYHLNKNGVKVGEAATIPIASLFLSQLAFVTLVITAIIFAKNNVLGMDNAGILTPTVQVFAYIGLAAGLFLPLLVILFALFPRFSSFLVKLFITIGAKLKLVKKPELTTYKSIRTVKNNINSLKIIAKSPLTLILSFILSMGTHLALCSIAYFTLRTFGFDLPEGGMLEWLQVVQMCMILYSVVSIAPTPGNSGMSELTFYWLFSTYAISLGGLGGFSFSAMITWRILCYYLILLLGITTILISNYKAKKRTQLK